MKNNSKNVIIGILSTLLIGVSVIAFLALNGNISLKSNDADANDKIEVKEDVNYSNFIGEYIDDSNKSIDDVRSKGGVILKIYSISEADITFEIETVSSNERVAFTAKEDINLTSIKEGVYNFDWKNDGWNSIGNGSITINDSEVFLSINTTGYSDDNLSGWSLGNFDNKEMYRVVS